MRQTVFPKAIFWAGILLFLFFALPLLRDSAVEYIWYWRNVRLMPKISTHEHYRVGGDMTGYLNAMRWANVEKAVFLPTDWPPSDELYKDNLAELFEWQDRYPDKIIVYATAWDKDPNAAGIIEDETKRGARGIKFIDWDYSPKEADLIGPVDSANMYEVYEVAKRYRVPVLLHIDFQKKPEWKRQFDRVANDFPDVKFILAHYCRSATESKPNLELCSDTLRKFPNVFIDIVMGDGPRRYMWYFDNFQNEFRDFILQWQDRILWGADVVLSATTKVGAPEVMDRFENDIFMLGKQGYVSPLDGKLHKGLALPPEVFKKIYYENPKHILGF